MNLYLLTQTAVTGYDTYDSAVVCAPSAKAAREIRIGSKESWPDNPEKVYAKYLGKAGKYCRNPDILCSSFNAG